MLIFLGEVFKFGTKIFFLFIFLGGGGGVGGGGGGGGWGDKIFCLFLERS